MNALSPYHRLSVLANIMEKWPIVPAWTASPADQRLFVHTSERGRRKYAESLDQIAFPTPVCTQEYIYVSELNFDRFDGLERLNCEFRNHCASFSCAQEIVSKRHCIFVSGHYRQIAEIQLLQQRVS